MTEIFLNDGPAGDVERRGFRGFDLCWAGADPTMPGYCFGSEHGQLLFANEDFTTRQFTKASVHNEAINGVAYSQSLFAVTTRRDINFLRAGAADPAGMMIKCGAFGVAVAPSGQFVFPLGQSGIMYVRPNSTPRDPVVVSIPIKDSWSYSSAIALQGLAGEDLIVCGGRRDGIGITQFVLGPDDTHSMDALRFEDLDIVDLCAIQPAASSYAIAAAARDGTIVLIRDILRDRNPHRFKFKTVRGVAYRILSAQGSIYLLTSRGLFVLVGLADFFLGGKNTVAEIEVLTIPALVSDMSLVDQKWLLAVGDNEVLKFDLEKLHRHADQHARTHEAPQGNGAAYEWQPLALKQTPELLTV